MNICDVPGITPALGLLDPALLRPGSKERSLIYERLGRLDAYRMHPYRTTVDEAGRALIGEWIDSLTGCP